MIIIIIIIIVVVIITYSLIAYHSTHFLVEHRHSRLHVSRVAFGSCRVEPPNSWILGSGLGRASSQANMIYYSILYYTILYYTVIYYTILYYTILYHTIPYHTILYYTIL